MFILLAAVVLRQSTLLQSIAPNPTGRNGYEEYLRAADIISNSDFNQYRQWLLRIESKDRPSPFQLGEEVAPPAGVAESDPTLAVESKLVGRLNECLNLLAAGNGKDVYDPRKSIELETTFREFTPFRNLGRLENYAAYVSFAHGDTTAGVGHIEAGMTFGSKISNDIFISFLVGAACDAMSYGELDKYWPQLSLDDAQRLEGFFAERLKSPPALVGTLKNEEKFALGFLDEILTKENLGDIGFGDDDTGLASAIAKLSGPERRSVRDEAAGEIVKQYNNVFSLLDQPESEWLGEKGLPKDEPTDPSVRLGLRLGRMIVPVLDTVVVVQERLRTQDRLAYLTAKAVEFRWLKGRLPEQISDFTTKEERTDPTTGRPFIFRIEGRWFTITRQGNDALGGTSLVNHPAGAGAPTSGPA